MISRSGEVILRTAIPDYFTYFTSINFNDNLTELYRKTWSKQNNEHTHGNKMSQTVSIKQSINVKHIQRKNKNGQPVLKESLHNETIVLNKTFSTY